MPKKPEPGTLGGTYDTRPAGYAILVVALCLFLARLF